MSTTLEKIAAADVSRILAERGIPDDKPVTVLVDEDIAEIARRMRAKARARGMTEKIFAEITQDM